MYNGKPAMTGTKVKCEKSVWGVLDRTGSIVGIWPTRDEARLHKMSDDRLLKASIESWTITK